MASAIARKRTGLKTPDGWKDAYLGYIRQHGGIYKAARQAGIEPSTAWREAERDPAFAEQIKIARQECADGYQDEMVEHARRTGNPVAFIVRLKQLRPDEYIERHAVATLNVNVDAGDDVQGARRLLQTMLGDTDPSTLQRLGIGDQPQALEAHATSQDVIDLEPARVPEPATVPERVSQPEPARERERMSQDVPVSVLQTRGRGRQKGGRKLAPSARARELTPSLVRPRRSTPAQNAQ